jgi:uncharacterized membrane protein YcaP (DUF421 family)
MLFIDLLGLTAKDLEWYQMLMRTLIVFMAALAFIRLSGMRTFGTSSAFDIVVSITLGAIMSRCIMGHYPFFPGLLTGGFLVCLHRLVAWLATRSSSFRKLTEGSPVLLFSNGTPKEKAKKKYNITDTEMMTALHEQNADSYDQVKDIWLEPDGELSVVKKNS